MIKLIITLLGGIGLFLLGMILMTDGLKSLAGDTLRKVLSRFTGGRIRALFSGAAITAIIQSSGATTVTTIGFVSAGLLTFQQSIGLIFGANLGTTSTSWIVSLLGLKFKIGMIAFPLVGIGAVMRLVGREKIANLGIVVAGFGLIFVGIDTMQSGMQHLSVYFNPADHVTDSMFGRLWLVALGIGMTVVMQSSSAAVAMTLTALHAGSINVDHAAALVIGQNIGTTIKAALASIGASVPAKRTALSHIMFNLITGIAAFIILPYFIESIGALLRQLNVKDETILLASFHTAFNVLGVILMLPFVNQFSKIIIKIIPEKGVFLIRHLDKSTLKIPSIAIEAVRRTIIDITMGIIDIVRDMIISRTLPVISEELLDELDYALRKTRSFLNRLASQGELSFKRQQNLMSILHAVDHVDQLLIACREFEKINVMHGDKQLNNLALTLAENVETVLIWLEGMKKKESLQFIEEASIFITDLRKDQRESIFEKTASGELSSHDAMQQVEALRWLDRVTYRMWRALFYLGYHTDDIETYDMDDREADTDETFKSEKTGKPKKSMKPTNSKGK